MRWEQTVMPLSGVDPLAKPCLVCQAAFEKFPKYFLAANAPEVPEEVFETYQEGAWVTRVSPAVHG